MIKGSIQERMDYEDFIRNHKEKVPSFFENVYVACQTLTRCYRIRIIREKRDLNPNEITILNVLSLAKYLIRLGGLLYTWFLYECVPEVIRNTPHSKVEWYITVDDITNFFIEPQNKKIIEAILLKSNIPTRTIHEIMGSIQQEDRLKLQQLLLDLPADNIFRGYKLVHAFSKLLECGVSILMEDETFFRQIKYTFTDMLEVISCNQKLCIRLINEKIMSMGQSDAFITSDYHMVLENIKLLFLVSIRFLEAYFDIILLPSDQINQTIREILAEPDYQKIWTDFFQSSDNIEKYDNLINSCLIAWKDMTGEDLTIEESLSGISKEDRLPRANSYGEYNDEIIVDQELDTDGIKIREFILSSFTFENSDAETYFKFNYLDNICSYISSLTYDKDFEVLCYLLYPFYYKQRGVEDLVKKHLTGKMHWLDEPKDKYDCANRLFIICNKLKRRQTGESEYKQFSRSQKKICNLIIKMGGDLKYEWMIRFVKEYWPKLERDKVTKLRPEPRRYVLDKSKRLEEITRK